MIGMAVATHTPGNIINVCIMDIAAVWHADDKYKYRVLDTIQEWICRCTGIVVYTYVWYLHTAVYENEVIQAADRQTDRVEACPYSAGTAAAVRKNQITTLYVSRVLNLHMRDCGREIIWYYISVIYIILYHTSYTCSVHGFRALLLHAEEGRRYRWRVRRSLLPPSYPPKEGPYNL